MERASECGNCKWMRQSATRGVCGNPKAPEERRQYTYYVNTCDQFEDSRFSHMTEDEKVAAGYIKKQEGLAEVWGYPRI